MKKGWEIKKLGEVCEFINGKAYKKEELLSNGKYPVLRVGNLFTSNQWYYSDLELDKDKYCESGDLIYAWSASFGPRIWIGEKVIYHYHIWKVVPNSKVISKDFLFQLLEWDTQEIKSAYGTGATMMHVGKGSIEQRKVPIPPLPEQQLIVQLLDEAFEKIDTLKANAERNLQNAKELFESALTEVLKPKEGWEEKKLSEICNLKPQKNEIKNLLHENDIVTFLPMEDLGKEMKTIVPTKEKKLGEVYSSYTYFADNDVLLAKITPCFENGKVGIATNLINGVGFGSSEYIVLRTLGNVISEYIFYFVARKSFREEGRKLMSGAVGHKRVSKEWIDNYLIPFPKSLTEQQTIVEHLDALSARCKALEINYQKTIAQCDEMKKAVLAKAFNGEL